MKSTFKSAVLATGLAMFSMFFGAGNIVFPLVLGQYAGDKNIYAISGLFITAIVVPFTGLIAMILFQGNYRAFFHRIGKIPGTLFIFLIMIVIGPLAGIPRCITLSYSTSEFSCGAVPFWAFSLVACALLFLCAYTRARIVDILGYVLSPILIIFLFTIIILGFIHPPAPLTNELNSWSMFSHGLKEGYNTLDLLAAFFFSTVALYSLKRNLPFDTNNPNNKRKLLIKILQSTCIAAGLLTVIYTSMSFIASFYATSLLNVPTDKLLARVAHLFLGKHAGIIAGITVALTCLTTAITLCAVFATFFKNEVFKDHISYHSSLFITVTATFVISFLRFSGIINLIAPILFICYPTFIALTLLNLANKLWGIKFIKTPVTLVFLITLFVYFL